MANQDYRAFTMQSLSAGNFHSAKLPPPPPDKDLVAIDVEYSSLNYKDALAITGKGAILKKYPLVPGIDLAGKIAEKHPKFEKGETVLVTGCGLGESFDGGFQSRVYFDPSSVIRMPAGLDSRRAMILGTAGFTAGLCLLRMEDAGQNPKLGPIVITGASGGVGSLAVHLFSQMNYEVIAVSEKKEAEETLRDLGAKSVIGLSELGRDDKKPLSKARFGGAIDNLGGDVLAVLLRSTALWEMFALLV